MRPEEELSIEVGLLNQVIVRDGHFATGLRCYPKKSKVLQELAADGTTSHLWRDQREWDQTVNAGGSICTHHEKLEGGKLLASCLPNADPQWIVPVLPAKSKQSKSEPIKVYPGKTDHLPRQEVTRVSWLRQHFSGIKDKLEEGQRTGIWDN